MKTSLLSFILLLLSFNSFPQQSKLNVFTDFDIAYDLIGQSSELVEEILNKYEIEYWITDKTDGKYTIYISYNNSIRLWRLDIKGIYRDVTGKTIMVLPDVVAEIFVRYRHSNLNDLKNFYAYDIPENEKYRTFEKSLGVDVSHFKIIQN